MKLYAKKEEELQRMLEDIQEYSRDIGMSLGKEKCAILYIKRDKGLEEADDVQLMDGTIFRQL